MSADSTNVVQIFGYFQEKRFEKALECLCFAYEAHLAAEQHVLEALLQIGWDEGNMTEEEEAFCAILKMRAEFLHQSGEHVRQIMRDIAGEEVYPDEEESSED